MSFAYLSSKDPTLKIQLLSNVTSTTSRGVLSKAWYSINGNPYLVKGNTIVADKGVGYEPYSEVMASVIANILGLDHVIYGLADASLFPEIEVSGIGHVSFCPSYLDPSLRTVTFEKYIYALNMRKPKDELHELRLYKSVLPIEPLYTLLLFDALIGNEDRHRRNIEIVQHIGGYEQLAPIFDNGASLLAWCTDEELILAGSVGRLDKAKPFRTTHRRQINLIPKGFFPRTDIELLYHNIVTGIQPMSQFITERRFNAVVKYLGWRLKYLEKVMR